MEAGLRLQNLNNDALGLKRGRQAQELTLDKVGMLKALGRVVSTRRPERKEPCQSNEERQGFPRFGTKVRKYRNGRG